MPLLIDKKKKIILYFLILILLSTINNRYINYNFISFSKIQYIKVLGLSENDNLKVANEINKILPDSIFSLNKKELTDFLFKNNLIESFRIQKIYPNTVSINIKKTDFLAKTSKENKIFFIGSNAKLIDYSPTTKHYPFVFGKLDYIKFVNFKKIIDKSGINFNTIQSIYYYPSNRWDIKDEDGILIKLPEKNLLNALKIVNKIKNDNQFIVNNFIDLRIPGRIIIENE
jgi:cell division protein FtsQ